MGETVEMFSSSLALSKTMNEKDLLAINKIIEYTITFGLDFSQIQAKANTDSQSNKQESN